MSQLLQGRESLFSLAVSNKFPSAHHKPYTSSCLFFNLLLIDKFGLSGCENIKVFFLSSLPLSPSLLRVTCWSSQGPITALIHHVFIRRKSLGFRGDPALTLLKLH